MGIGESIFLKMGIFPMSEQYPSICNFENLYLAYRKARLGKRSKEGVARFKRNLECELLRLEVGWVELAKPNKTS